MSNYTKAILFDIVSQSATFGKIVTSVTDNVPILGGRNVYYEISGPLTAITGTLIYAPDFNNPDGFVDISNPTAAMPDVDIPLDSNGEFQEGQYTIKFYFKEATNPSAQLETDSLSFTLDVLKQGPHDCELKANIDVVLNCHCYTMTITDRTNYRGSTLVSRVMTITPPAVPSNSTPPAPITTTFQSYSLAFTHTNVTYGIGLYSVYENTFSNGQIIVREDLDASIRETIKCDFNLCALIDCIRKEYNKLIATMGKVGGWSFLESRSQDWWQLVENKMVLLYQFINCEKWDKVDEVYAELKKLVDCDCGCDGGVDSPVPVSPSCGGSGSVTNIVGSYPITVNQSGTTAIIGLDNAYAVGIANSIANLQASITSINAAISALQASRLTNVTTTTPNYLVITTPVLTPTVRQINFDPTPLEYTGWLKITNTQANNSFGTVDFDNTTRPLQLRSNDFLGKIDVQGNFTFDGNFPNMSICITIPLTYAMSASAAFLPIVCFNSQGTVVGALRAIPNPAGTEITLMFNPNTSYVPNSVVYVNGTFNTTAV